MSTHPPAVGRARLGLLLWVVAGYAWLGKVGLVLTGGAILLVLVWDDPLWLEAVFLGVIFSLTCGWVFLVRPRRGRPLPLPDGVALASAEAAPILAEAAEVRLAVGGPRVRRVVVAAEPVATVGGPRASVLVVGLPLLVSLDAAELRALIGLALQRSSRWGRVESWADELAAAWARDGQRLQTGDGAVLFSKRLVPRYARRLGDSVERLRAAHARAVDAAVAAGVAPEALGSLLVKLTLVPRYLQDIHWPSVWARADLEAEPPPDVFRSLHVPLATVGSAPRAEEWLTEGASERPEPDIPGALEERLALVGQPLEPPRALLLTAGDVLLGTALADVAERLEADWRNAVAAGWRRAHEGVAVRLAELESLEKHGLLEAGETVEYALLVERFRSADEAQALLRRALEELPDDPLGNYSLGRLLLAGGSDEGLALLERAMSVDERATAGACSLAAEYLRATGRSDAAAAYALRGAHGERLLAEAESERAALTAYDELVPHGLSAPELAEVVATLETVPEVERAYVARKTLRHYAEEAPVFLVGAVRWSPWWRLERRGLDEELRDVLVRSLPLPGDGWVVVDTSPSVIQRWFRGVAHAEVFRRRRRVWRRRAAWSAATVLALLWLGSLGQRESETPSDEVPAVDSSAPPAGIQMPTPSVDHPTPPPLVDPTMPRSIDPTMPPLYDPTLPPPSG